MIAHVATASQKGNWRPHQAVNNLFAVSRIV